MIKNQKISIFISSFLSFLIYLFPQQTLAFPIYAQQAYENPREANGRIVCANCHLAAKPTEFEAPSAVLADKVFETVVKIPYDTKKQQVLGNGQKGGLNVGAVVILPEGFKLAPKTRLTEEIKVNQTLTFLQNKCLSTISKLIFLSKDELSLPISIFHLLFKYKTSKLFKFKLLNI